MMTCEESQRAFSLYLDGELTHDERLTVDEHLAVCPVCRQQSEQSRAIIRRLALVARPLPPPNLAASINEALVIERAGQRARPKLSLSERFTHWLEPHLMPYAVGAFYSLLLFVAVFGAVRNQMQLLRNLAEAERLEAGLPYQVTWVGDEYGPYDVTRPLAPGIYEAARTQRSPSLDPRGALAEMAWSPPSSGQPDDGDMIVVADVYGNGNASIAAVVEPPRDPRMLDELQEALRKNPAFVPASLDRRPQTMRVVFALQKMNVQ